MGTIATNASAVFRDFFVDGVSGSGANEPAKADIRNLFKTVDDTVAQQISTVAVPVESASLAVPPGSPTTGLRWIVAAGGSGAWAGQDNAVATWTGTAWTFLTPTQVYVVVVKDAQSLFGWNGTAWADLTAAPTAFALLSALTASTVHAPVNGLAVVYGDTTDNNGLYMNTGTVSAPVWTRVSAIKGDTGQTGAAWSYVPATGGSVAFANATPLPDNTYANGAAGVGATITGNSNGALSSTVCDGVTPTVGMRCWIWDYTGANGSNVEYGLYIVTQVGDSTHPFILTRATDANTAALLGMVSAYISGGTANVGLTLAVTQGTGAITLGTTAIIVAVVGGTASISAEAAARVSGDAATLAAANAARAAQALVSADLSDDVARGTRPIYAYDSVNYLSVPTDGDVLNVFIVAGQSNAASAATDPAVAAAPHYFGRALMPDHGPIFNAVLRSSTLVDAYETTSIGYNGETILTSMMSHLVQACDSVGATGIRFAGFVSAAGGMTYGQLKRGSLVYHSAMSTLEDVVAAATRGGFRVIVRGICYIHGESDTTLGTSRSMYGLMLRRWHSDLSEDIKRVTGQADAPRAYLSQTNTVNPALPEQAVQMAQLDAGAPLAGTLAPWATLVGPIYNFPRIDDTTNSIHLSSVGQNRLGQLFARAIFADMMGVGWRPLTADRVYFKSSTIVSIDCNVPVAPLVLDTTGTEVTVASLQGLNGFDVRAASGYLTIASMAISGATIDLTMSAPVTATMVRVMYGMRRNSDGSTYDGPSVGARGLIRDSSASTNLFQTYSLTNWLCQFEANVPVAY